MRTLFETSQIPTRDKKSFTKRSVESLAIKSDSITAKITEEKFDFFIAKLKRVIDLSGIDESEILNVDMDVNIQNKTIILTGNIKQALELLVEENAISQLTYQEAINVISEMQFQEFEQSVNPDKLAEMCLKTLQNIINNVSDTNKGKTTKSMEDILEGLKSISPRNET